MNYFFKIRNWFPYLTLRAFSSFPPATIHRCILALGVLISSTPCLVQAQISLKSPVEGVYGEDYVLVNHVDEDTSSAFTDAFCGTKSYNGHAGSDFVIKGFLHMDDNVPVFAAADGIVFATVDGFFDRNKLSVPAKGFGNWIGIQHTIAGQNFYTYYAHVKSGSIKVDTGDVVKAGDTIAYVGSSGNSSDPHLHFEVYNDTVVLDPWDGLCQYTPNTTLWVEPMPYDTAFSILNHSVFESDFYPFLDTIREPYFPLQRYDTASKILYNPNLATDTFRTAWFLAKGVRYGDTIKAIWINGTTMSKMDSLVYVAGQDYWFFYFWSFINVNTLDRFSTPTITDFYRNSKRILRTTVKNQKLTINEPTENPVQYYTTAKGVYIKQPAFEWNSSNTRIQVFDVMGNKCPSNITYGSSIAIEPMPNVKGKLYLIHFQSAHHALRVKWIAY